MAARFSAGLAPFSLRAGMRRFCATVPPHQGRPVREEPGMDQQIGTDCVLGRHSPTADALCPPGATPTTDGLPRRIADFDTLAEALDYAAKSSRGMNFHDARGALVRAYPYSELREDSLAN